ncbi:MAG: amidohydrolase [Clostridia bacterium]|nr:amidohydrolase [Clostridia bacterium]
MSILIKNIKIITSGSDIYEADVYIENDKIKYIGAGADFTADTVINGAGRVLMPGLINTHTHSSMTLFRSYAEGLSLEDWLFTKIFPAEARLCGEDVKNGTLLAAMEMIASGTTCFNDMYFFLDDILAAVSETGIRAQISRGLSNNDRIEYKNEEKFLDNLRFYKDFNGAADGRVTVGYSLHAVYTCSPEYLKYVAGEVKKSGGTMHIHLSETETENKNCLETYGVTPTVLMDRAGVFDISPCVAAHCVHLSDEDIKILQSKGVFTAMNPSSNLKLRSGIPDIKRLNYSGINWTIGTDGASSNNNLNMFEEMHLAALLSGLTPDEVITAATKTGAKALGLANLGEIKEGYKADLIIVDIDRPHFHPIHDLRADMVYSAQGADVETVIINGKIVYKNREFLTADFEKIKFEAEKSKNRLCI